MTVLTVYSDTADGDISSSNAVYTTARAGSGLTVENTTTDNFACGGQALIVSTYYCFEGFLSFDTSSVGSGSVVSAATLSLYGNSIPGLLNYIINANTYDWGTAVDTGDWIAGASLTGTGVNCATRNTAVSGWSTTAYNAFTSQTGFPGAINKTGSTRLILFSDRHAASTVPTDVEYVTCQSADTAGTSQDPKLVVTYTAVSALPKPVILRTAVNRAAVY